MNLLVNLHKPLQPSIVTFLKAQECGFQNGFPNVCCRMLPSRVRVIKQTKSLPLKGPELLPIPLPNTEPELTSQTSIGNQEINLDDSNTSSAPFKLSNAEKESDILYKKQQNRWKSDLMNIHVFDSFTPFDLFRRRRKVQGKQSIDIEIR